MIKKAVVIIVSLLIAASCASLKEAKTNKRKLIVRAAKNMIDKRYEYGGQDRYTGFDCSGLTQFAYGEAGVRIPRTAYAQYNRAEKVKKEFLRPGDLVFFSTLGEGATHVGIYLGDNKFIHAPSKGKKVQIVSMENSYWKSRYFGAGSYIK